ncbi:unnamed protein product [Cylicocyclus nassatus]|uniref:Uncharacterized protein n=1 Tax=Cylicocyclus nassatus TaxID=53992 RepID=A0AA36H8F3_CYLNA|nr:unnamed protein product [Cylicocyclus nassatus]
MSYDEKWFYSFVKLWQFLLMRVFFIVLAFLVTAHCLCKVGGRDRDEDEKWVDGSFLMQCLKVGEWGGWRTTILACMVDNKQVCGFAFDMTTA